MGKGAPDERQERFLQARAREMQELGEGGEALSVNDAILSAQPDDLAAQIRRGRCLLRGEPAIAMAR